MTEFADTTSSLNTFCGGSGVRGDSNGARSSAGAVAVPLSVVPVGEFGKVLVDGVAEGHVLGEGGF
jgi:hypothetical protein